MSAPALDRDDPPVVCDYCVAHPELPPPKPMCDRCARLCDDVIGKIFEDEE